MRAPIAAQLYSLREEAAVDFPAVLARLGEIGYVGVEPASLHGLSADRFTQCVADAGMVVSSAHGGLPKGDNVNQMLDDQQAIGCSDLIVAFLPPDRFLDRASVELAAEDLNAALEHTRPREMKLGYHNHYWEFSNQIDGQSAHALLFELLDPEIFAELDLYWAHVGGANPAQVLTDLGARARFLHVKDGPADSPKSAMTAVGDGTLDFPPILAAGEAAEWHIVELDRCDTDMFEAIERSYQHLVGTGLSRGRE
jgi:sugar phosphate isomerase/epimerase